MKKKIEVLQNTINTKQLLEKHFKGTISDEEFAYELAQNDNLRKTATLLTQKVLHPTPLESLKTERTNMYIDLGMGISAFWDEMRTNTSIEVKTAAKVENIIMNVEAGLDKDLDPDTRKIFLTEVGFDAEQISEFVPISDYVEYEERMKAGIRNQLMSDMGLKPPLNENDQLLIETLLEEHLMNDKMVVDNESVTNEPTYEDIYGISAEDLYHLFTPDDKKIDHPDLPTYVSNEPAVCDIMQPAMDELEALYAGSIDENIDMLIAEMEQEAILANSIPILSEEDLAFVNGSYEQDMLSEEDLAFAYESAEQDVLS